MLNISRFMAIQQLGYNTFFLRRLFFCFGCFCCSLFYSFSMKEKKANILSYPLVASSSVLTHEKIFLEEQLFENLFDLFLYKIMLPGVWPSSPRWPFEMSAYRIGCRRRPLVLFDKVFIISRYWSWGWKQSAYAYIWK